MRSEPLDTSVDLAIVETPDPVASVTAVSADSAPEASAVVTSPSISDAVTRPVAAAPPVAPPPIAVPLEARHSGGRVAQFFAEIPLTLVILGVGLGLVVIALHHFRWGSLAISVSVLAGGLLRLVLPTRKAGLLAVRGRFTDVLTMGLVGGALMVLAAVTST